MSLFPEPFTINSMLIWLDMSVCNLLHCNEDIFVNTLNQYYEYLPLLHIILNNTLGVASVTPNEGDICSTPEGLLEVHEVFYDPGRV